jgi:hypothetical protein
MKCTRAWVSAPMMLVVTMLISSMAMADDVDEGPASQPASQPASMPATQPASMPATRPASMPATQPASQPALAAPKDDAAREDDAAPIVESADLEPAGLAAMPWNHIAGAAIAGFGAGVLLGNLGLLAITLSQPAPLAALGEIDAAAPAVGVGLALFVVATGVGLIVWQEL